ncbi:D-isomer specific 2-hydroxyacid dehydrogenase family protein [Mycolicibacterium sp. YH-1]|uniref:D-isomer specific 2-hydroxyacid dehydrogenase family protein n=1 Tax=Mycolicibacterium sp. YH-1 TaxID=2908837 RepID=UPI001F4C0A3F|nr:D-isomer specific 2-hydroxyacid dehydrogenase family protein [Mycolicibacterium sp. YH-1]UNB54454.1 D-isomer specific 2-hydroxyacid dehydrogenase family protein [Mycolicibacterium sp. YH-1]
MNLPADLSAWVTSRSPETRMEAVMGQPEHFPPESMRPPAGPVAVIPHGRSAELGLRPADVTENLSSATGLVWREGPPDQLGRTLDAYPNIRWVQLPMSGVDSYQKVLRYHGPKGVLFTSAKGSFAQPVAEHALMLVLALLRFLPERIRTTTWGPPKGRTLYGANIVIVGAGGIAVALTRLLAPFSVQIVSVRRKATPMEGATATVTVEDLSRVLPDADVVIVAAALTEQTRHLFAAQAFAAMKNTAIFVNVGRGELVNTPDLISALESGRIAAAGLDVTEPEPLPSDSPLWRNDRCIITPHSGDPAELVAPLLAERILRNVEALHSGKEMIGVVDTDAGY